MTVAYAPPPAAFYSGSYIYPGHPSLTMSDRDKSPYQQSYDYNGSNASTLYEPMVSSSSSTEMIPYSGSNTSNNYNTYNTYRYNPSYSTYGQTQPPVSTPQAAPTSSSSRSSSAYSFDPFPVATAIPVSDALVDPRSPMSPPSFAMSSPGAASTSQWSASSPAAASTSAPVDYSFASYPSATRDMQQHDNYNMSADALQTSLVVYDENRLQEEKREEHGPIITSPEEDPLYVPPHPDLRAAAMFAQHKQTRVRTQIAAGVGGAVFGLVVGGPIGMVVGGVAGNKITKVVAKKREKKWQERYHQKLQEQSVRQQEQVLGGRSGSMRQGIDSPDAEVM